MVKKSSVRAVDSRRDGLGRYVEAPIRDYRNESSFIWIDFPDKKYLFFTIENVEDPRFGLFMRVASLRAINLRSELIQSEILGCSEYSQWYTKQVFASRLRIKPADPVKIADWIYGHAHMKDKSPEGRYAPKFKSGNYWYYRPPEITEQYMKSVDELAGLIAFDNGELGFQKWH